MPAEDGAVAARLKATGGILLGKTNTPHFGYKDMCDNLLGPPCRNPWNVALAREIEQVDLTATSITATGSLKKI